MEYSRLMAGMRSNVLSILEERRREIVAAGREVFNLSAGTPDLAPDGHVMRVLSRESLDPLNYRYAISDFPELLDAAVGWYARRFGVRLERDQVCSLYGSQEGMAHVFFPFCNPGDGVLLPDPCYPVFAFGPRMAGAVPHWMPLEPEKDFLMDFDAVPPSVAHRAKMIVVSYPNNPTTAAAPPEFYERLVHFARRYDIFVLHDNAYCELVLDGEPGGSFLAVKGAMEVGVEFNSLSKSYNLTGMRLSFALGNRGAIAQLRKFRSQIDYGPFPAIQKAAIAVLEGPQDLLRRNREEYRRRRDALCGGLREIGWEVPYSASTMFTWFPLPGGRRDDKAFVLELLEKTGVIGVPGSSFGETGRGFVRFALVQPALQLRRAVRAIADSGILSRTV